MIARGTVTPAAQGHTSKVAARQGGIEGGGVLGVAGAPLIPTTPPETSITNHQGNRTALLDLTPPASEALRAVSSTGRPEKGGEGAGAANVGRCRGGGAHPRRSWRLEVSRPSKPAPTATCLRRRFAISFTPVKTRP